MEKFCHLLIDGGHLIRRIAYTKQGQLQTSDKKPGGVAHGFFSSLIHLSRQYKGNARAYVAFDSGKSEYRVGIYPDYKCKRNDLSNPEYVGPDIHTAKMYIAAVLKIIGIPCFMSPGIEADDFIAALSFQYPTDTVIVSSDQDFFQLVTEEGGVTMLDPIKKVTYDVDKIVGDDYDRDRWLDQLILHKSIVGHSDEIPQICRGLGPKTALPIAKRLSYGCKLLDNRFSDEVMYNLDLLDRNISLYDLRESVSVLRDQISEVISKFIPSPYSGLELEKMVLTALSKWELESVSGNVHPLLSLRVREPIVPNF